MGGRHKSKLDVLNEILGEDPRGEGSEQETILMKREGGDFIVMVQPKGKFRETSLSRREKKVFRGHPASRERKRLKLRREGIMQKRLSNEKYS